MTDDEFKRLIQLEKSFVNKKIQLPIKGNSATYDLICSKTNDTFLIDIDRTGKIELYKMKLQTRYGLTKLPLVRVDIDSPPHQNPDGKVLSRNHIHIFRETENDIGNLPWAYDLKDFPDFSFDENNIVFMDVLSEFCKYCNIILDNIQGVL